MFPAPFVTRAVMTFTEPGDVVMDPFSGRGNAPFVAAALGRPAVAVDIQPVAWLFTAAKLRPARQPQRVLARLRAVAKAVRATDRRSRSRFETMAWAPAVRGFLKAARRELDWKSSLVDRTLMAFVALHMQDSYASGLSNRLSPTVAHSPSYAVRWWTAKGLLKPPATDPVAFLTDRITRRYAFGPPQLALSKPFPRRCETEARAAKAASGQAADHFSAISRRDGLLERSLDTPVGSWRSDGEELATYPEARESHEVSLAHV